MTATAILIASSLFPTIIDAPAEQSKSNIRGSLNCFRNRSQSGSGSSCGSSLGPWSCNLESASAGVRPLMREVCNRSAVWEGVRLEYSSDIDYRQISACQQHSAGQRTLATEDGDLLCPLLDLDLSLDRGREGGSEFALCIVGRLASGKRGHPELGPGLADREMRGQDIIPRVLHKIYNTSSKICCR